jgi:hypothetical protein
MKEKRKWKRWFFGSLSVMVLLPVWAVLFTRNAPPAVDYDTVIELPSGKVPLGAIVAALEPSIAAARAAQRAAPQWSETNQAELEAWLKEADPGALFGRSLYDLGLLALEEGRVDQGVALLRSIPRDDRQYSRAQRYLGWKLYTQEQDNPEMGMSYMLESLRASPFEGNVWQDLYRVSFRAMTPGFLR